MKKRLFFNKYDDMKYISHLDLLRVMDRLLRRVGVPIKFSQGFHPRPKISLGNPISLGTEAYNEPMDIELSEELTNEDLLKRLRSKEILGFDFVDVKDIDGKTSIVDDYTDIKYEITGESSTLEKFVNLLNQDEIILVKVKKGKEERKDLKPRVKHYDILDNKLTIIIENMSPNSFLKIADIEISDVAIKRYSIENKKNID